MKSKKLPDKYLAELGNRIKIIRTYLNVDQKKMAELTSIAQSQISKIETGKAAPSLKQLIKIKTIAEKNKDISEGLSWEWIIEGKGKGVIG